MSMTLINQRSAFPEFDALMRGAFGPGTASSAGFNPAAEVRRDGDDAIVSLELPGVDIDQDVTVEIDRSRLVVRGERRDTRSEEKGGRGLREMRYGSFRRSFSLPSHVTADAVSATYDAGLLHVRVADVYKGTEPQRISIASTTPTVTPVEAVEGEQSEQE